MEIKFEELHFMERYIYFTKIKKKIILTLKFFTFKLHYLKDTFLKETKKIHFYWPRFIYAQMNNIQSLFEYIQNT